MPVWPGPRQERSGKGPGLRARERARNRQQGRPGEAPGDGRVRPIGVLDRGTPRRPQVARGDACRRGWSGSSRRPPCARTPRSHSACSGRTGARCPGPGRGSSVAGGPGVARRPGSGSVAALRTGPGCTRGARAGCLRGSGSGRSGARPPAGSGRPGGPGRPSRPPARASRRPWRPGRPEQQAGPRPGCPASGRSEPARQQPVRLVPGNAPSGRPAARQQPVRTVPGDAATAGWAPPAGRCCR